MEKVILKAEREVAVDSPDHLAPLGTKQDNSRNYRFNEKLYALYSRPKRITILDLGCSGGGFVRDCVEDGFLAVGLEGSDFSKKHKRAEWKTIPENLFTCDITMPFELSLQTDEGTDSLRFDVVTAWEVMEHIAEQDLPQVVANVERHLQAAGLWIMSISTNEDLVDGRNLHQTMKPKTWWVEMFRGHGLEHREEYVRYFNTQFVRGPKYGAPTSFHLVLSRPGEETPRIPRESWRVRLYDRLLNSRPMRKIKMLLTGPR